MFAAECHSEFSNYGEKIQQHTHDLKEQLKKAEHELQLKK